MDNLLVTFSAWVNLLGQKSTIWAHVVAIMTHYQPAGHFYGAFLNAYPNLIFVFSFFCNFTRLVIILELPRTFFWIKFLRLTQLARNCQLVSLHLTAWLNPFGRRFLERWLPGALESWQGISSLFSCAFVQARTHQSARLLLYKDVTFRIFSRNRFTSPNARSWEVNSPRIRYV